MILSNFHRRIIPEIKFNSTYQLLELRDKVITKWSLESKKEDRNETKLLEYLRLIKGLTNKYNQMLVR